MDYPIGNFVDAVLAANLRCYKFTPSAAAANSIASLLTQPASGTTVFTSGITQPDFGRNVSIVGNQATCTGNVVITGLLWNDVETTETLALNGTTPVVGSKAWKYITSITVPALAAADDKVSVGRGSKLAVPIKLPFTDAVFAAYYNGVKEGTAPTVNLTNNTALLNTALAGAEVRLYFFDN